MSSKKVRLFDMRVSRIKTTLKWHNVLIYFLLWAGATFYFYQGVYSILGIGFTSSESGLMIFSTRYSLYNRFTGLQITDIIFGITMIAIAALFIVTAIFLAKLNAKGPILLTTLSAAIVVREIAYVLSLYSILGDRLIEESQWASMNSAYNTYHFSMICFVIIGGFSIAMLLPNYLYYHKREFMFWK